MTSSTLIRLSGLAAVASGILLVVSELLNLTIDFGNLRFEATTGVWFLQSLGFMLGNVLLLGALVGLYLNQAENAGTLGLAGFLGAAIAFFPLPLSTIVQCSRGLAGLCPPGEGEPGDAAALARELR